MKDESKIRDWRSTGRRKARRALFGAHVPFRCCRCGKTTTAPPKDAPVWFDEIWPEERRVLKPHELMADHESKDYENNELDYINWKCPTCHKADDSQTAKGVPQKKVNLW